LIGGTEATGHEAEAKFQQKTQQHQVRPTFARLGTRQGRGLRSEYFRGCAVRVARREADLQAYGFQSAFRYLSRKQFTVRLSTNGCIVQAFSHTLSATSATGDGSCAIGFTPYGFGNDAAIVGN